MHNALINKTEYIHALVMGHGYIPILLPPYSPALKPIDELWAYIKYIICHQELERQEIYETCLHDASEGEGLEGMRNYINNVIEQYFLCAMAMEEL